MKKTIAAIALAVFAFVPTAFAYPVTSHTTAVHSYRTAAGTRVGSYLRRNAGTLGGLRLSSPGSRVSVRTSVRNNSNGTQSLVREHVRSSPNRIPMRVFTTTPRSAVGN